MDRSLPDLVIAEALAELRALRVKVARLELDVAALKALREKPRRLGAEDAARWARVGPILVCAFPEAETFGAAMARAVLPAPEQLGEDARALGKFLRRAAWHEILGRRLELEGDDRDGNFYVLRPVRVSAA